MNTTPPGEDDEYDVSIHGKLSHLDAVDLSKLTLSKRYAMITLSGPWASDDYGRFTTSGGADPRLPALTEREARSAVRDLIKDGLIRTWTIGGTTCWEVAGAYAFKPGLNQALWDRKQIAIRKREDKAKRRERKKDADAGFPFAKDDDGEGMAEDGSMIEEIRTVRGNIVSKRAGLWYRSKVPVPKRTARDKMLLAQPDRSEGINLRMLPSFDPSEGLSALGTVLRYCLLMDCDGYGRVRLDIPRLYQQLGSGITKRISIAKVEAEIDAMVESENLLEVVKKSGRYAFIRDSAQHMLNKKPYDRELARLHDDQQFTHDSERYLAFHKACEEHSLSRDTVQVAQYNLHGNAHVVDEYVEVAAKRFVKEYQDLMKKEPWMHLTPERFCFGEGKYASGISDRAFPNGPYIQPVEIRFWYAITCNLPVHQIEQLYRQDQEMFDGSDSGLGRENNMHKIFSHLLNMTPKDYIEQRKAREVPDPPPQPPAPTVGGSHWRPESPLG